MSPWKIVRIAIVAVSLAASGSAFATGAPPAQNHHCKMPDGTIDMAKTHKACTAAKGTWAKDAPAKDAPKDTTKAGATRAPAAPPPAAAPPAAK